MDLSYPGAFFAAAKNRAIRGSASLHSPRKRGER
jgi:hypothetical protein